MKLSEASIQERPCAKLGHSERSCHWQRYYRHFTDPETYLLRACNPNGTTQISARLAPWVYTWTASKRKTTEEVDGQYPWRLCRDGHVPYSGITSCLGQGSMEEHYSQQGLPTREDDIVLVAWALSQVNKFWESKIWWTWLIETRLIARRQKFDSISSTIRDFLHWLPIRQRVDFKLFVLVFNCLRNSAPSYLTNMCQPVKSKLRRRFLRSAVRGDLIVPPTRTVRYGLRSFAVAGPSTWNALPTPP